MSHISSKQELLDFINQKIKDYSNALANVDNTSTNEGEKDRNQRSAVGELNFYIRLRTVINNPQGENDPNDLAISSASLEDLGNIDAVNDTMVKLGYVPEGEKFYTYKLI